MLITIRWIQFRNVYKIIHSQMHKLPSSNIWILLFPTALITVSIVVCQQSKQQFGLSEAEPEITFSPLLNIFSVRHI